MKKSYFLIIIFCSLFVTFNQVNAQTKERSGRIIQHLGIGTSFNAVADEVIFGLNIYSERNLYQWKNGRIYYGLSTFVGAFPNLTGKFNQYAKGRSLLFQPIHVLVGHQFNLLDEKFLFKTGISAGPTLLQQKITINDNRYNANQSFSYQINAFTIHTKLGFGIRMGERNNLTFYTNLPVANKNLAFLGIGIAFNKYF